MVVGFKVYSPDSDTILRYLLNYCMSTFPALRMRRMRRDAFSRSWVRENSLQASDLIYPVFVCEGRDIQTPIEAMPGIYRWSLDRLLIELEEVVRLGILAVALFPVIAERKKSVDGTEALNPDGLVPKAITAIKEKFPDLGLISDVALDPYTSHGHDGILDATGNVVNDPTTEQLSKQALLHALHGVDVVAPSDMMDGRVATIRSTLESNKLHDTKILSYAAKYASSFYTPFRQAIDAAKLSGRQDKTTYQMDPANSEEAIREVALDLEEGADMVMIKPALPYLDVVWRVKECFQVPTFVYQVSGEYSMVKQAVSAFDSFDERALVMELLLACKRAGADGVFTYYAKQAASWLQS